MNDINEVTISGKLGKYFTSGTSEKGSPYYYGKLAVEKNNFTQYFDIKAFGDNAQQLEMLKPETHITVKGEVATQKDSKLTELLGKPFRTTHIYVISFKTKEQEDEEDKYSSINFDLFKE